MTAPDRWTVIEAGEEVSGPIRALDWTNPSEVNCVKKAWIKSLRCKPSKSKFALMSDLLGADDFWSSYPPHRDRMMQRCEVRVAVSASGATVLGWACVDVERGIVHYVYVQQDFRRRGLAKQLVADLLERDVWVTHWTHDGVAMPWPPGWRRSFLRSVT